MGYSVAIHCKSKEDQHKMKEFLVKNFKPYSLLVAVQSNVALEINRDHSVMNQPPHSNLGYDKNYLALGFNYGQINQMDNYYMWKLLQWMALKVGKLESFSGLSLPAVIYDGDEICPIFRTQEEIDKTNIQGQQYIVDAVGYSDCIFNYEDILAKKPNDHFLITSKEACKIISQLVKEELNRLDSLY